MRLRSTPGSSRIVHRVLGALTLGAGFAGSFGLASCTTPTTEIVAGLTTQIRVPDELKSVAVIVTSGGRNIFCRGYAVNEGVVKLPATLGVAPSEDRDGVPPEPVNVSVIGLRIPLPDTFDVDCFVSPPDVQTDRIENGDVSDVMVVRRAALQYTEDRILYMPVPLKESCTDVRCPLSESCVGGKCVDSALDGATVVDYRDELIFGRSNTCFSPERCLPAAATPLAVLTDAATCTYRFPVPPGQDPPPTSPGALNVEVLYASGGTEILDLDDREGFTFPDPNDPLTFRLAQNLCESQFLEPETPKILGVYAAPLCPAKTPLQPICEAELAGIQAGERSPLIQIESEFVCTVGSPLQATESLLYVLLDRSASMADLFGPEGLQFAVDIPLQNPVAARTRLALSWLPAAAGECPSGAGYLTPEFGFDDVEALRDPLAAALGDTATLLADDPILNLDGAMAGAYDALHAINDSVSATFNRKAVVVIGNRDLVGECGGAPFDGAVSLASAALGDADPIYTYVAVLEAPSGAAQFNDPSPQASAAAIATAGGTEVFDAVADEAEGALAVQKVLNDLGSCLYDPMSLNPQLQERVQHLSFVNPVTQVQTLIPRVAGCDAPDSPVDGFNIDSNQQVVICGQPCDTLRETLTQTAAYFAALGVTAPAVPVMPGMKCSEKEQYLLDPNARP